jgi:hypothetical protein
VLLKQRSESQKFAAKGWNEKLFKMDYWTSIRNLIGTSEVATESNIEAYINFCTKVKYVKILRSMP